MIIDNSIVNTYAPAYAMLPAEYTTYEYIIEYGNNNVIKISDPGRSIDYLPVVISKIDYTSDTMQFTMYLRNVKRYYSKTDTLAFNIEDSIGHLEYLCESELISANCDSILFTRMDSGKQYQINLDDSVLNFKSRYLFYPDIKFLPKTIIPIASTQSIRTLVDYSEDKEFIDSVIRSFTYENYEVISESEIQAAQLQFPIEQIKSYFPSEKRD